LLLFSWTVVFHGTDAAASGEPTGEEIAHAWAAREKRIVSGLFEWQEEWFVPKESLSFNYIDEHRLKPMRYPAEDTTYKYPWRVLFDARKIRTENWRPNPAPSVRAVLPMHTTAVADGEISKSFHGGDDTGQKRFHRFGQINRTPEHLEAQSIEIRAILLWYRPFAINQGEDFDVSKYEVSQSATVIGTRRCCLLRGGLRGRREQRLWVDADRDWVPVRWQCVVEGYLAWQLDVDSSLDQLHGWFPSGWTHRFYKSRAKAGDEVGQLRWQGTARVTRHALNIKIPDSDFRIDSYPPGTYVSDARTDEYYIAREDGEKRIITVDERLADCTYEELVATESGMAALRPSRWRYARWLGVVTAIALLVMVARALVVHRHRMTRGK
jgi:hypothetical protein